MPSLVSVDTFGVQSVSVTDATGGRVCLECVFSSFSTDSGCTVELVSTNSSTVQYSVVFNRSTGDTTAEGCIADVATGQYDIRVYDDGSTVVAVPLTGVNVTGKPTSTTTTVYPTLTSVSPPTSTSISTPTATTTGMYLHQL